MKKTIHLTTTLMMVFAMLSATRIASAQTPQAIPYQAVARDVNGNLVANQNISLRFSIVDQYIIPTTFYQETQTALTNSLGLFTVNFGQGTPVIGTFADINWGGGFVKYMKVEMDVTGGTNYIDMGSSPLLSVPYSLYSAKSGNGMTDGSTFGSTMYWNGVVWDNNTNIFNGGLNVGIGTSNPSTKLEVAGTTTTASLAVTGGASAGYLMQSDANGNANWTNPATIIGPEIDPQVSSATMNKVPKWNGNTLADGSIYDNGNVGIGTTNPLTKLEVDGQVTIVDGNQQEGKVLTSDDNGTARWAAPEGGDCFIHWQVFTVNGIFTVPPSVKAIKVMMWGGGGGGAYNNDRLGGGGGGYAEGIFSETAGAAIPIVVGQGGSHVNNSTSSVFNDGVNSMNAFGGGSGGTGGTGGEATGGYLNIKGGNGGHGGGGVAVCQTCLANAMPATPGSAGGGQGGYGELFSGGGGGGMGGGNGANGPGSFAENGINGTGGGGGGGGVSVINWGNGGSGKVVVFW